MNRDVHRSGSRVTPKKIGHEGGAEGRSRSSAGISDGSDLAHTFDDIRVSALKGKRRNEHGASPYIGCRDGVQAGGRLSAAKQVLATG